MSLNLMNVFSIHLDLSAASDFVDDSLLHLEALGSFDSGASAAPCLL